MVVVAVWFSGVPTTNAPGGSAELIATTDSSGLRIDNIILADTQSAATPTATGTQYLIQLGHHMLLPPNGQIISTQASAVFLIQCDTLLDACLIL
jgi:hypothetical protein